MKMQPWLPENALLSGAAVETIATLVQDWRTHWFESRWLSPPAQWVSAEGHEAALNDDWGALISVGEGLSLRYRRDASKIAAAALVKLPGNRPTVNAHDQELLQRAVTAIFQDLQQRLAKLARPGNDYARGKKYQLALNDADGFPILWIGADETLLVQLTKEAISPTQQHPKVSSRAEAIDATSTEAAALLGRASIPYRDLRELSVGDVLVLDAKHNFPVDLWVDGTVAARGRVPITDLNLA